MPLLTNRGDLQMIYKVSLHNLTILLQNTMHSAITVFVKTFNQQQYILCTHTLYTVHLSTI